jgi:hypothetical protein
VLQPIAWVLERVERLVFHFPPGSPSAHDLFHRCGVEQQVDYPAPEVLFALIDLPILQEVNPPLGVRTVERQVVEPAIALLATGTVDDAEFTATPGGTALGGPA